MPSTVTFTFFDATGLPAGTRPNSTTFLVLVQSIDQNTFWALRNGSTNSSSSTYGAKLASVGRRLTAAGQMRGGSAGEAAAVSIAGWLAGTRRRLQSSSSTGASAVGNWTNCSSPCTYTGLPSGYYSFSVREVDTAGNVGNATTPSPFQVECRPLLCWRRCLPLPLCSSAVLHQRGWLA